MKRRVESEDIGFTDIRSAIYSSTPLRVKKHLIILKEALYRHYLLHNLIRVNGYPAVNHEVRGRALQPFAAAQCTGHVIIHLVFGKRHACRTLKLQTVTRPTTKPMY